MKENNTISELSYVELKNGNVICLEDICSMYSQGGYSYHDYFIKTSNELYGVSGEEYTKIKSLLREKSLNYTCL